MNMYFLARYLIGAVFVLPVPGKKEAPVISDTSLTCLAQSLGDSLLKVVMYLNVPTVTIINTQLKAREKEWPDTDLTTRLLLLWKEQRELAKDKDKVADLERALRDCGKAEMADVVSDKHRDGAELTPESLRV